MQKILLHSELTNLGVQVFDPGFIALLSLLSLARKGGDDTFLGLLFPLANLIRMHAILASEFGQGVLPDRASRATRVLNSAVKRLLFWDMKSLLQAFYVHLNSWSSFRTHFLYASSDIDKGEGKML